MCDRPAAHLTRACRVAAPGEARPDWQIVTAFALTLDAHPRTDARTLFPFEKAEAIYDEHRAATTGRDLEISGLSYGQLDEQGPQVVCACWNVRESAFAEIAMQSSGSKREALARVQETLKCATQCGSCLPEVKRIVAASRAAA